MKFYKENITSYIILIIVLSLYFLTIPIMLTNHIDSKVNDLKKISSYELFDVGINNYISSRKGFDSNTEQIMKTEVETTYKTTVRYGVLKFKREFSIPILQNPDLAQEVTNRVENYIRENKDISEDKVSEIISEVYSNSSFYSNIIIHEGEGIYIRVYSDFANTDIKKPKELPHQVVDRFEIDISKL